VGFQVKYIATNTNETSFNWVVDMPVGNRYWVSLFDGSGTTMAFGLRTVPPANSSCDQSLLQQPFDAASLSSAAASALARKMDLAMLVGLVGLILLA
jgi:hypothetical protein